MDTEPKKGHPFLIVATAILIVFGLSFISWGSVSCNRVKNYDMLSGLKKNTTPQVTADEIIDPELENALAETEQLQSSSQANDSTPTQNRPPKTFTGNTNADGVVIFEDYTPDDGGMKHLRNALLQSNSRPVRIAVIGDSYIEGDILTMNIREMLQDTYGGAGVGYMPASSELTGYRVSVSQKCSGWKHHEIRKNMRDDMKILPGEYFVSEGNGQSTYNGVTNLSNLKSWNKSMVLAVAPQGGTVTLATDTDTTTVNLESADNLQAIILNGTTSTVSLKASAGVEIAGVFLNNATGVSVDNMSLRGNSGQTHRKLSVERAQQMRQYVDYDLIVVEYGINALSSQQSDYSGYKKLMVQTIEKLKECYPNADILMMGIGDRGQKIDGTVQSLPTSQNMVDAQRAAAIETGVLFWDTRQAMGGEGAVVDWRSKGLINPDYIHLNAKGGKALAELFVKALNVQINK